MIQRKIITGEFARRIYLFIYYEILNYGLTELDLAFYIFKSPNSCEKRPRVEVLKTSCVIVTEIFRIVIIICSYDWGLSNKFIHLIRNSLIISHVTRIRDSMYL
jgi:hypothetical protein